MVYAGAVSGGRNLMSKILRQAQNKTIHGERSRTIVIFGGMFDPPHVGHAFVVDAVLRNFKCDEVWITPSGERKDKIPKASGNDRWRLANIFCEDYFSDAKIPVLPCRDELDMPPPTYTWAFYQKIKTAYPYDDFYFLMGSYNIQHIKEWQNGEKIFSGLKMIFIPQDGDGHIKEGLPPNGQMLMDENIVTCNVSSTLIRERIKRGLSSRPYVLPRIADYIVNKKLYI